MKPLCFASPFPLASLIRRVTAVLPACYNNELNHHRAAAQGYIPIVVALGRRLSARAFHTCCCFFPANEIKATVKMGRIWRVFMPGTERPRPGFNAGGGWGGFGSWSHGILACPLCAAVLLHSAGSAISLRITAARPGCSCAVTPRLWTMIESRPAAQHLFADRDLR